ncbi:MAG: acetyl-CoA carboxylase biotin carboxyl carrier protein [Candidatus Omnitrophica bacterium]|nr:acetyl-CoA carboxylase biotin carboxyl carrier protein [Candidatus Omnitrophota bacterium]
MNLKELKEMINLMNENNLTELELEREGLKIRLRRGAAETIGPNVYIERAGAHEISSGYTRQSQIKEEPFVPKSPEKSGIEIKSPMVGTFYRTPSPEASAFVEVGSDVEIGQVVCIIEAMKLMNEIKSEVKGKVKEIAVENADPVEFGQVLFRIETA